ncbi:MAG: hypothetical protein CMM67_04805 [Rhodospirillaceae bacterium]|nr:hypothetical protein [Rhodospirillaceae bacterium]OUT79008.1 MAG: hypothetical protein CBB83_04990 [Rhodospirillaceae bacterium TMED23]
MIFEVLPKLRSLILSLITGVVIGILLTINSRSTSYENNNPVSHNNWKLVSSFQSENDFIGEIGTKISNKFNSIEKGKFFIKFYGPNTLIPNSQIFNAVKAGKIEFALTTSKIWKGKSSAFELFNGSPFGPDILTLLSWFYDNEGKKIYESLYSRFNIHSLPCGITGIVGAGWFNKTIEKTSDLKGLKVATSGLVSEVYKKVGAKIVKVNLKNLINAFKLKQIDAVTFSIPLIDKNLDLSKYAKYYYMPGWNQQSGVIDLIINKQIWGKLGLKSQNVIESICLATNMEMLSFGEANQFNELKNKIIRGAEVKQFGPKVLRLFEKGWKSVAEENSKNNKDFEKILKSIANYKKDYLIWNDLSKVGKK